MKGRYRSGRWVGAVVAAFALLGLLAIPPERPTTPEGAGRVPFVWDRDAVWQELEKRFDEARGEGCKSLEERVAASFEALEAAVEDLGHRRGVTSWLAALGVEHFTTQGPSDLEYDPKLRVVAEWRDPETLYQDHVDNAILDVLLEGAETGDELRCSWVKLPLARLLKLWSVGLNLFGRRGPIPEGMGATAALRVRWLHERHAAVKERTLALAEAFAAEKGYTPPYWELVALARQAKTELDE